MISEIFYWILNMSIIGSISGLVILLLRKVKSIPRFFIYYSWSIVLIRMIIPFGIGSKYSLMSLLSKFTTKTISFIDIDSIPVFLASNFIMGADGYFPIVYKSDLLKDIFHIASIIWIGIALILFLIVTLLYFSAKSDVRNAILVEKNIYRSVHVSTPAVYGIIHPKIILPAGITKSAAVFALAHEKVHIKRKDNLFRTVAIFTACLHWFNPLAWLFLKAFFMDMELSCDRKVVKCLPEEEKNNYARALLQCAENKQSFMTSAFGSSKTKTRIEYIMSYKKLTAVSCLFLVALFFGVAIALITNARI